MIEKILSPSIKSFLINSGVVTGLSLTSLAGVAMMHFETDRTSRHQAYEVQRECAGGELDRSFPFNNCESQEDVEEVSSAVVNLAGFSNVQRDSSPSVHRDFDDSADSSSTSRQK